MNGALALISRNHATMLRLADGEGLKIAGEIHSVTKPIFGFPAALFPCLTQQNPYEEDGRVFTDALPM